MYFEEGQYIISNKKTFILLLNFDVFNSWYISSKKIKGSRKKVKPNDVVYFDELIVSSEEQLRRRKRDEYDLPSISGGIE